MATRAQKKTYILVINCGSSSVKYKLFSARGCSPVCGGLIERIGQAQACFICEHPGAPRTEDRIVCPDHDAAIYAIIRRLSDPERGIIDHHTQITGVGHRVVHGGERFHESVTISAAVIEAIEEYCQLAPLHNPPALLGIRAAQRLLAHARHIAVFDTAFHQTIPEHAFMYALPYELYTGHKVRKYGFHGTSHRYVAYECARRLKKNIRALKIVTCHLGNGCSMAAVMYGRSVDTSMGFTPLPGLVMGTRCGDIDPAIVFFLMKNCGMDAEEVETLLNKKSGILGVSGVGNDMRDINRAIADGNKRAVLAKELFLYRIKAYLGMYAGVMDGLDAVVFTAGIGEHDRSVVTRIKKDMAGLFKTCRTNVMVIPTNEEYLIARDTYGLLNEKRTKRR